MTNSIEPSPIDTVNVQALCAGYSERVVRSLMRIIDDPDSRPKSVVDAGKLLLAYAHGTPIDRLAVQVQARQETGEAVDVTPEPVHLMSLDRLAQRVALALDRDAGHMGAGKHDKQVQEGQIIEVVR